jgi:acetyl esterase
MRHEVDEYLVALGQAAASQPADPTLPQLREWYRGVVAASAPDVEIAPLVRSEWVGLALDGRTLRALLQVPTEDERHPVVVYFHGGGYALADPEATEATTAALAAGSGCAVLSVDYRLAPEHPYPGAHHDALDALRWIGEHGADLGLDVSALAVAGDSSGAALALHAAVGAARENLPAPKALALFYGWYDATLSGASMAELGPVDPVLPRPLMEAFRAAYFGDAPDAAAARLGMDGQLPALGDTCLVVGGADPLRSDSETLAATLRAMGNTVEYHCFDIMPHGFSTTPSFTDGRRSVQLAASFIASRLVPVAP